MKKTTVFAVILALIIALAAPTVFAAGKNSTDVSGFIKSMFDSHRSQVDSALKKGEITQNDADQLNNHFDAMQKFHEKNGFGPGMMNGNGSQMMGGFSGMMGAYN